MAGIMETTIRCSSVRFTRETILTKIGRDRPLCDGEGVPAFVLNRNGLDRYTSMTTKTSYLFLPLRSDFCYKTAYEFILGGRRVISRPYC
jgi:hypothetical protein